MRTEPDPLLWQLGLFTADPPAQKHSETSVAASESMEPRAGTLRAKVLAHVRSKGNEGATDEEMQWALAMNPSTQRPRRIELEKARLVKDSHRTRLTRSGRAAVVWVAT